MFFKINDKLAIGAERYQTRYSWGHKAHLYRVRTPKQDDLHIESAKITYYNRTWERYEFESILYYLVEKARKHKTITEAEAKTCNDYIKAYEPENPFKAVVAVAKMGEILTDSKAKANDWKARMLKAGLPHEALSMPEDWDELSEDEKARRLDGAIAALQK